MLQITTKLCTQDKIINFIINNILINNNVRILYIIMPIEYQYIPSYTQEHAINFSINIKINNNVRILY